MGRWSDEEWQSVLAGAGALVSWEEAIGGSGFPDASPSGRSSAHPAPEERVPGAPLLSDPPNPHTRLQRLAKDAADCTRCELHRGRTKSVFARGSPDTDLAFVGEGPGFHEDQQGLPFVGRAGQLLDRMITAMGYARDHVYICNVVKCRPPDNRTPLPSEASACARFLVPQLETVDPKVIIALGRCAAENLSCVPPSGKWRGIWGQWRGIPVMPTYHPAFLLRSPQFKKPVWEDLQEVLRKLDRPLPPKR